MSSRPPGRRKTKETVVDSQDSDSGGAENDAALKEDRAIRKALNERLKEAPVDRMRMRLSEAKKRTQSKIILYKTE